MPKMKTHKGASKRFRKTGSGKVVYRKAGQDHFNARESGKTTKNKRRDMVLNKSNPRINVLITNK
ncbi:50S ribosomal protein L35 [Patescibacteria group bacterium]|nr:50S ribosomal protein L35 [Patescibacteria group bacterium]